MSGSNLHPYAGRWIARINANIVACAGSPDQVYRVARASRFKEVPIVTYIPLENPLSYPSIFYQVQQILQSDQGVYLVGGAVRDALMGISIRDLDFVCLENTRTIARKVANSLKGAFYAMDDDRQIYRVIVDQVDLKSVLDFAAIRGNSLEEDQINRDFTINAIAVDIQDPQKLLDPLGGAQAVAAKTLSMCSPVSFLDDPVRIVRGVRIAAQFSMKIEANTRTAMKNAVSKLETTTIERIRDECFKIADLPDAEKAFKALFWLCCERFALPVLGRWENPERKSCMELGLQSIAAVQLNLQGLIRRTEGEVSQDVLSGTIQNGLKAYRRFLRDWFDVPIHPERSRVSVFNLCLLHLPMHLVDPSMQTPDLLGSVYHLSNPEKTHISKLFNGVVHLLGWAQKHVSISKREQYRFFKEFGPSGVDSCLAAIAVEAGGTKQLGSGLSRVESLMNIVPLMLNAWINEHQTVIDPPVLLNGTELMEQYNLPPGPQIGDILEYIREKQAVGEISTTNELPAVIAEYLSHR